MPRFLNDVVKTKYRCECDNCGKECWKFTRNIKRDKNGQVFCSPICQGKTLYTKQQCECETCGKKFMKAAKEIMDSKHHFCSYSCSGKYHNTHKTKGTNRSKLEVWLEEKLTTTYPNLEFHFNKTDTIKAELDIYIPSLKLAFELNGIFHYEPIYGTDKLERTKFNDNNKFLKCHHQEISLCVIDTSKQKHFKEKSSIEFLNIIISIIESKSTTRS